MADLSVNTPTLSTPTLNPRRGVVDLRMSTAGKVTGRNRAHAESSVAKLAEEMPGRVIDVSVRLQQLTDGRARPSVAKARIRVDNRVLRAHVAGESMHEAIDAMVQRLRQQAHHLAQRRQAATRRGPSGPENRWRHGNHRANRPEYCPRPPEEREIVRHKTFTTRSDTIEEAVWDLEALDYDFLVFTDADSGQDAFLSRREDGGYQVQCLHGFDPEALLCVLDDVEVDPDPAPVLHSRDAQQLLDESGRNWLFFRDRVGGRGHALYRRYDGHYGLITPR